VTATGGAPSSGRGLRIVSRCQSEDEFIALFRRFCTSDAIFIVTRTPKERGARVRFAITLADGAPMLCGAGEVVESHRGRSNEFARPGMRIRFSRLDEDSRRVLSSLVAPETPGAPAPDEPAAALPEPPALPDPPVLPAAAGSGEVATAGVTRARRPSLILPANPLGAVTEASLVAFVECTLHEDTQLSRRIQARFAGVEDSGEDLPQRPEGNETLDDLPTMVEGREPAAAAAPASESARVAAGTPAPVLTPGAPAPVPPADAAPAEPVDEAATTRVEMPAAAQPWLTAPDGAASTPGRRAPWRRVSGGGTLLDAAGAAEVRSYIAEQLERTALRGRSQYWVVGGIAALAASAVTLVAVQLLRPRAQEPTPAVLRAAPDPGAGPRQRTDDRPPAAATPAPAATAGDDGPGAARRAAAARAPGDALPGSAGPGATSPATTAAADAEAAPAGTGSPGGCQVSIRTIPDDAEVWIGKERIGLTPLRTELPCGATIFTLKRPRWVEEVVTRELRPGRDTSIVKQLERPRVRMQVASRPGGATVSINGETVGETPLERSVSGFMFLDVQVSKPGYQPYRERVYTRERRNSLRIELRKTPAPRKSGGSGSSTKKPASGKPVAVEPRR
jgi:hypothetical protein